MEGIDVSLIFVIPKVIFDQHLHADLSFGHTLIISDPGSNGAKEMPVLTAFASCAKT